MAQPSQQPHQLFSSLSNHHFRRRLRFLEDHLRLIPTSLFLFTLLSINSGSTKSKSKSSLNPRFSSFDSLMENCKADNNGTKTTDSSTNENPNNNSPSLVQEQEHEGSNSIVNQSTQSSSTRTPFTNLSQVDADLALARTLQEQERAYMMLRMNGDGSDYGSWEAGSYVHEDDEDFDDPSEDEYDDEEEEDEDEDEDAFDVHAHAEAGEDNDSSVGVELDPASFPNDEEYARALQDAEEREMAARLLALAGINDREAEDTDDHGGNSQDTWEELDPDQLSYEELLALGEVVGTESRGLSSDTIASLPSMNYKTQSTQDGNNDSCVICRLDYEDGDTLTVLSCKHLYHSECINNWLRINKRKRLQRSAPFAAPRCPHLETASTELDSQCCLDTEFGRDHGQLSGVIPDTIQSMMTGVPGVYFIFQSVVALSGLVEMLIKLDHVLVFHQPNASLFSFGCFTHLTRTTPTN
ncbi:unnamed protein product [Camellia sinensis]